MGDIININELIKNNNCCSSIFFLKLISKRDMITPNKVTIDDVEKLSIKDARAYLYEMLLGLQDFKEPD